MMIDWETRYRKGGAIWTYVPSNTAETAARWFREMNKKSVYIVGVGYGRNIPAFLKHHLEVSGIDVSKRACQMGEKKFPKVPFTVGSYSETEIAKQEAIYCFDVIHCLSRAEQVVFIKKMYEDLIKGGVAYVTVLSNVAQMSVEERDGRTLFSETSLIELCSVVPFEIESITPYTDMFYSTNGRAKQYPLLCIKLHK